MDLRGEHSICEEAHFVFFVVEETDGRAVLVVSFDDDDIDGVS